MPVGVEIYSDPHRLLGTLTAPRTSFRLSFDGRGCRAFLQGLSLMWSSTAALQAPSKLRRLAPTLLSHLRLLSEQLGSRSLVVRQFGYLVSERISVEPELGDLGTEDR